VAEGDSSWVFGHALHALEETKSKAEVVLPLLVGYFARQLSLAERL
jgi:hypothetical protein